jgi:hypothetical protein
MVRALLRMTETPEPADAADALAVALCHIHIAEGKAHLAAPEIPAKTAYRRSNRASAARIPSLL